MSSTNDSINKTCDTFAATVKLLTPLVTTLSGNLSLNAASGEIDLLALLSATLGTNAIWGASNQTGDFQQRWNITTYGDQYWGNGFLPLDTKLSRLFSNTLTITNQSGGAGNLSSGGFFSGTTTYSTGTVGQTGTAVTGSGTTFTSAMEGGLLVVGGFISSIIISVNSATSLTVSRSTSIGSASSYAIYYGAVQIDSSGTVAAETINLGTSTVNGVVVSDSHRNLITATPLTDGQLLIGVTGSTPTAAGLTAGNGITVVNAAGSITISSDDTYQGGIQQFTSSGTFNVPSNVVTVYITACGGGGGGAGGSGTTPGNIVGAGGAGGGFTYKEAVTVTPGDAITITIGTAGAAGSGASNGSTGGATSFGSLLTLAGGGGGSFSVNTPSTPGNSWASGGGGGSLITATGTISEARGEAGTNPFGLTPSYSLTSYGLQGGYGVGGVAFFVGFSGQAGKPGILIVEW